MKTEKSFKGKAIYNPSGKAKEYSYWACNFYNGCSGMCSYCYCKKGITAKVLGGNIPTLKKCFKYPADALNVFTHEIYINKEQLREHGLFFSFTTDPLLPETYGLTWNAISSCHTHKIPVKVLTKNADGALKFLTHIPKGQEKGIAIGFTLTGHDELEPGCSTNVKRIQAMKLLHGDGFKTFGSYEPIIDIPSTLEMIAQTVECVDLFKIGLMSGKKYDRNELCKFMFTVQLMCEHKKIYFKDSLLKAAGIERNQLPLNCVNRDYNIFE